MKAQFFSPLIGISDSLYIPDVCPLTTKETKIYYTVVGDIHSCTHQFRGNEESYSGAYTGADLDFTLALSSVHEKGLSFHTSNIQNSNCQFPMIMMLSLINVLHHRKVATKKFIFLFPHFPDENLTHPPDPEEYSDSP